MLGLLLAAPLAMADGYDQGPAIARGMPWSGGYAGFNAGYAWTSDRDTITYTAPVTGFTGTSQGFDSRGGFVGGQIGYNWRLQHFVLGIETDIQGGNIKDDFLVTVTSNGGPLGVDAAQRVDYFGTVRARLGYAFDRTLLYATGGFAYGGVRDRVLLTNGGATARLEKSATETGFALGGGVEHYFGGAYSVKLEYQYIDLGSEKITGVSTNGVFLESNRIENTFHTVRLGLNYHFNSDYYAPLK